MTDEAEPFECKLTKVESLETYFATEFGPGGECRPCRLQPLASLYLGVLEQAGESRHAETLSNTYDGGDILTIARAMDTIRVSARDSVRKDLERLDCFAQSYEDS